MFVLLEEQKNHWIEKSLCVLFQIDIAFQFVPFECLNKHSWMWKDVREHFNCLSVWSAPYAPSVKVPELAQTRWKWNGTKLCNQVSSKHFKNKIYFRKKWKVENCLYLDQVLAFSTASRPKCISNLNSLLQKLWVASRRTAYLEMFHNDDNPSLHFCVRQGKHLSLLKLNMLIPLPHCAAL